MVMVVGAGLAVPSTLTMTRDLDDVWVVCTAEEISMTVSVTLSVTVAGIADLVTVMTAGLSVLGLPSTLTTE